MPDSKEKEKVLLDAIKALLKGDSVVQKMFKEFGVDIEDIEHAPLEFAPLKVSAKTRNGKIYLNKVLLEDGDFSDDIHYIVHELRHWLQQTNGDVRKYRKQPELDYLDLPAEVEAFRDQIEFITNFYGEERAVEYLEDLLDVHEFEGDARDKKYEELIGN